MQRHSPLQPMYFGDLFAEIEPDAPQAPPPVAPTQAPAATAAAATQTTQAQAQASQHMLHFDANLQLQPPHHLLLLGGDKAEPLLTSGDPVALLAPDLLPHGLPEANLVENNGAQLLHAQHTATTATGGFEDMASNGGVGIDIGLPPHAIGGSMGNAMGNAMGTGVAPMGNVGGDGLGAGDGTAAATVAGAATRRIDDAIADASTGKRRKQELHRRHSKRYRDNLGELFSELEQILPQVVPDCKLKTKSQIIATSVSAVKQLKNEVGTLEMRYVMSSQSNRARWVEDTVASAAVIQDAIEPFMRLLLGLQAWKHAELWTRAGSSTQLRLERVTSAGRFLDFVKGSQVITFEAGDDSLVGRIAQSLQPEWLDLHSKDALTRFKRGALALSCGLCVCFAVPFLVRGHVVAVVLFYDNTPRADVNARVSVAQDLASAIGNCFGALAVKKAMTAGGAGGPIPVSAPTPTPAPLAPNSQSVPHPI